MQLFYSPDAAENALIIIDSQEHIHLTKVLRKTVGDQVHVTNGKGHLFSMEIVSVGKKRSELKWLKTLQQEAPNPPFVLAVAPTKNNSRYEWMIEKCVEFHVPTFQPFTSFHSERRSIKNDRFEQIALGAMKQSLQNFKPEVLDLISFNEVLNKYQEFEVKLIAYCAEQTTQFSDYIDTKKSCVVLVGPEGGFSPKEANLANEHGFVPISLGKSRLRTETAGIFIGSMYFAQL